MPQSLAYFGVETARSGGFAGFAAGQSGTGSAARVRTRAPDHVGSGDRAQSQAASSPAPRAPIRCDTVPVARSSSCTNSLWRGRVR